MTKPAALAKPQVHGEIILPIIAGRGALENMVRRILAEHGLDAPEPAQWYPLQNYLEAHRALAATVGPMTLKTMGKKLAPCLRWPADIKSPETALGAIDTVYHMHHRGGSIGHYYFEQLGAYLAVIACDTPYPCAFDWGLIEATAKMFAPLEAGVIVQHDDRVSCRQCGGQLCTYHISW